MNMESVFQQLDDAFPHYILQPDQTVRRAASFDEYCQSACQRIAYEQIDADVAVSTIFIGIDAGAHFRPLGLPMLFETMVFGGRLDRFQERYENYADALVGHRRIVASLRLLPKLRSPDRG